MENPVLPPQPQPSRHIFAKIVGFTALVWLVIFLGYTGFFLWKLKFGNPEEIARVRSQYKSANFTAAASGGTGPQAPTGGTWQTYIHAYTPQAGLAKAPVTIVAFIDFECPFCQADYSVFKDVVETYGGAVRIVYKYLPLTSIHPNALNASEAAACANDQGKFWPYYHYLFTTKKLAEPDLQAAATAIGLEPSVFANCFSSHKHRSDIEADVNEAIALGVRGTPTYFVNNDVIEGGAERSVWDSTLLHNLKP